MKSVPMFCRIGLIVLSIAACASLARAQATPEYGATIKQGEAQLEAGNADLALASGEAAIKSAPAGWEGHALTGRSLLSLRRYEPAADALSKAIELAPPSEQPTLRDLRRQCLLAESTSVPPAPAAIPAQSTDVKMSVEAARRILSANEGEWVDASTGLAWARPWHYPPGSAAPPWDFAVAQSFCSTLKMAGYSNWRLPSAEELQQVFLPSSSGWHRSVPRFAPGYGVSSALTRGTWAPTSFTVDGDKFQGNRLLIWTSTAGDRDGEHSAYYFGVRHSVKDDMKVGDSLWGHMINPFQGYALCVRTAAP